jgi:predicted dehydrogenase
MSKLIDAILIGAGQRGANDYGPYALIHPDQINFIAVAEPILERRKRFADQHNIPLENQFNDWEEILSRPQMARAALICTQDNMHVSPTLAALQQGYDVLVEKPIATSPNGCRQVVTTALESRQQLHVCHVLRHTRHFQTMRRILQSDVLGQIVNVEHRENVSWWHMSHSYVRGAWSNVSSSSPMIVAKCCHDFDILTWMLNRKCVQISSIGGLMHFHSGNAPPGTPKRCLDGCPSNNTCPYYAPFLYIDLLPLWRSIADTSKGTVRLATQTQLRMPGLVKSLSRVIPILRQISEYHGWPRSILSLDPTPELLLEALRTGPYGRCVYHCDNDVVDHQVVMMQYEGDLSVTLTMHGHHHIEGRSTRIEGSRASLNAFFGLGGSWIEVNEHRNDRHTRYDTTADVRAAHGAGDSGLMAAFVDSLREGKKQKADTMAQDALESHLLAFAAEQARLEKQVISTKKL